MPEQTVTTTYTIGPKRLGGAEGAPLMVVQLAPGGCAANAMEAACDCGDVTSTAEVEDHLRYMGVSGAATSWAHPLARHHLCGQAQQSG